METIREKVYYIKDKLGSHLASGELSVEEHSGDFSTNPNVFVVKVRDAQYIVKFFRSSNSKREENFIREYSEFIPVADIEYEDDLMVVLKFIPGELYLEKLHKAELDAESFDEILEFDILREKALINLNNEVVGKTDFDNYKSLETNKLFYQRVFGDRFKEYYKSNNFFDINGILSKKLRVNGKEFRSINEIFTEIRNQYVSQEKEGKKYSLHRTHGDATAWNIIYSKKSPYFIDLEYADYVPSTMVWAKPFYSDFIGTLFYFYPDGLGNFFKVLSCEETSEIIDIKIEITKIPELRLKILENRIKLRDSSNFEFNDFVSLNTYMFLCHTLTFNPSFYSEEAKKLFLAFAPIIYEMDTKNPRSFIDLLS